MRGCPSPPGLSSLQSMSSRRVLCASCFCLPCPVAKTIDPTLYPSSPAGYRRQARWDEATLGRARLLSPLASPNAPPVRGSSRPAREPTARGPAPLSALLLRGSLSKGGARPSPVGAHAGHAPATGGVRRVPAWLRETSDDEGLPTDRQVPTCRQTRGRHRPLVSPGPAAWDVQAFEFPHVAGPIVFRAWGARHAMLCACLGRGSLSKRGVRP
jgi:hypothetical protein